MNFEQFKQQVKLINKEQSIKLRQDYINIFVNTEKEHFTKYIATTRKFSDGLCYTGYLWDCINNPVVIDENYLQSKRSQISSVYVMWDIHSKDRIFIENYWKFEKDAVIKVDYVTLLENLKHLPEDIYIFDDSFKWTLIFTHEYFDEKRWCLKTGDI